MGDTPRLIAVLPFIAGIIANGARFFIAFRVNSFGCGDNCGYGEEVIQILCGLRTRRNDGISVH
jgi:ferredoxin-fold anticodon binding domain-containing protein